jgi:hypothetical protein
LKLGQWQQHLPWHRGTYVTQSDTKVYFASEWAVVEIDKAERSPRFITKVEGLSDVGMQLIRYSRETGLLLLAYTNSNIDLYRPDDGSVVNLPYIRTSQILGDKRVYDVAFQDKSAFLATGFGIVKLNLERAEIEYTVFTDLVVRSFAVYAGHLYAGTEEGLFRLPADDPNPADFGRWQPLGADQGFPAGDDITALAVSENRLFFGFDLSLYRYDGTTVEIVASHPDQQVVFLTAEGPGLVVGRKVAIDGNDNGSLAYLESGGAFYEIGGACDANKPLYVVEDGAKKFWIADRTNDYRYLDLNTGQCDKFSFNSPLYHATTEIAIARNEVYVTTPGATSVLEVDFNNTGIYILKEGQWKQFGVLSNPELADDECFFAMWRVAPHPTEDKFYVGSFYKGLIEAQNGGAQTRCFTKDNSILQSANSAGPTRTAISGLAFDENDNLWIANYYANSPIAVLKPDGQLRNFSGAPLNNLLQVAVDQNGYKWFVVGFNGGVLVYDSGQDLDSPADDRYKLFTTANSALPTNSVTTVAVDLEGDVWVGTGQGVVSFECGSNVFDPSCTGRRRIVTVDDFNGYLLETEEVRSIAVDGGNRKWFGTTNGIFVQSPDGLQQVARYSTTNSPLFDNTITDIAINPKSGEVWIGTEKGLISLRGEATEGGRFNSVMPYAYPNPVRPDYDGPIAIYGLARDANVKITDVAGNLVYEGKALGGQAVWNGRDYLGRRAASGVYLIFATSSESFENPEAVIAKVMILN